MPFVRLLACPCVSVFTQRCRLDCSKCKGRASSKQISTTSRDRQWFALVYSYKASFAAFIDLLTWIFFLKELGWHLSGISGGPISTPPPCITCGTAQEFFGLLLGLESSCFGSFCQLFCDFSASDCKFVYFAKTILNLFAIVSFSLSCKLNFLLFAASFSPAH